MAQNPGHPQPSARTATQSARTGGPARKTKIALTTTRSGDTSIFRADFCRLTCDFLRLTSSRRARKTYRSLLRRQARCHRVVHEPVQLLAPVKAIARGVNRVEKFDQNVAGMNHQ